MSSSLAAASTSSSPGSCSPLRYTSTLFCKYVGEPEPAERRVLGNRSQFDGVEVRHAQRAQRALLLQLDERAPRPGEVRARLGVVQEVERGVQAVEVDRLDAEEAQRLGDARLGAVVGEVRAVRQLRGEEGAARPPDCARARPTAASLRSASAESTCTGGAAGWAAAQASAAPTLASDSSSSSQHVPRPSTGSSTPARGSGTVVVRCAFRPRHQT